MTEINLFPKFIDKAVSPVAESVGDTLSSVWEIVFGGLDFYAKKKSLKREEALRDFKDTLDQKASEIPPEKLVEPALHIIGPALESSKYYFENSELRNMFANLIASSINSDYASITHPSFVEIIKQLSPDEAKIMKSLEDNGLRALLTIKAVNKGDSGFVELKKNFTDIPHTIECNNPELSSSYIENLNRLGLISIDNQILLVDESHYDALINYPEIQSIENYITEKLDRKVEYKKHTFTRTEFGEKFFNTCILSG